MQCVPRRLCQLALAEVRRSPYGISGTAKSDLWPTVAYVLFPSGMCELNLYEFMTSYRPAISSRAKGSQTQCRGSSSKIRRHGTNPQDDGPCPKNGNPWPDDLCSLSRQKQSGHLLARALTRCTYHDTDHFSRRDLSACRAVLRSTSWPMPASRPSPPSCERTCGNHTLSSISRTKPKVSRRIRNFANGGSCTSTHGIPRTSGTCP